MVWFLDYPINRFPIFDVIVRLGRLSGRGNIFDFCASLGWFGASHILFASFLWGQIFVFYVSDIVCTRAHELGI